MLQVSGLTLPLSSTGETALVAACKKLGLQQQQVADWGVSRLSVDARHGKPQFVWGIGLTLAPGLDEGRYLQKGAVLKTPQPLVIVPGLQKPSARPVVCGLGPAGLFAALLLAKHGARPLVLERGPSIEKRAAAWPFFAGGERMKTPTFNLARAVRAPFQMAS